MQDSPSIFVLSFFFFFLLLFRRIAYLFAFRGVRPATGHLDRLGPSLVCLGTLHLGHFGGKGSAVGPVHVLELRIVLPNVDGKSSRNGGSQGGRLVHRRAVHGHLDDIGLGLLGSN